MHRLKRPPEANPLAGLPLDRMGHRRMDGEWLAERLADPTSRLALVWRELGAVVPVGEREMRALLLRANEAAPLLDVAGQVLFLGAWRDQAHFALDLSTLDDPKPLLSPLAPGAVAFADLREIGTFLPDAEAALIGYARALTFWHRRHRFCGACGAETVAEAGGHIRRCTNTSCGIEHFPRTDPAVIMLTTSGDWCALGRQPRFPEGMYSTLAGFVEPGESLEEAVAREVAEEVGLEVIEARYQHSQPWPFPASIMLGFRAEVTGGELTPDPAELEDARWFHRDELRDRDRRPIYLPRRLSIARRLIDDWLAE